MTKSEKIESFEQWKTYKNSMFSTICSYHEMRAGQATYRKMDAEREWHEECVATVKEAWQWFQDHADELWEKEN